MSAPPLPPPPPHSYYEHHQHLQDRPPPLPPLPPDINYSDSPPHFDDPLAAPRPHRLDPAIPANMARNLDDQASMYQDYRRPTSAAPPPPPGAGPNYTPGFAYPRPPPQHNSHPSQSAAWSPWVPANTPANPPANNYPPPNIYPPSNSYTSPPPAGYTSPPPANYSSPPPLVQPNYAAAPANPSGPYNDSLSSSMANLSFSTPQQHPHHPRAPSVTSTFGPPPKAPSPPRSTTALPSLTATLPTLPTLTTALPSIQQPTHDPALKIAWCRDVLFLVDRLQQTSATDTPVGPAQIADPQLARLVQIAVPIVLEIANNPPTPMPPHVAEAVYLRATFAASGAYPEHVRQNPRSAFRDFETAARAGYVAAWFRLGRDYENFNDVSHAKDCFERGVKLGVESCAYRMGMAHLMGQLGLASNPELAVPLLHRAATLASIDVPQPAYVYGLLLLNEFSHVTIPPSLFAPYIPAGSTAALEARKHLERAAYLNFAPAQYKLGHAYEFAQPPFPFDALLSVQYYSLASQQGEIEADMALSKWFLCGAEGAFEKDEGLAFTFADKAARKGLPSAEFAMGYYAEVGVGGPKDIDASIKWYTRASEHGNADATERLKALSLPSPQALSRQEHDTITENKLVRKRTQAKQRSEIAGAPNAHRRVDSQQVVEVIRRNSLMSRPDYGQPAAQFAQAPNRLPPTNEQRPPPANEQRPPTTDQRYTSPAPSAPDPRYTPSASGYTSPAPSAPEQRYSSPQPQNAATSSPRLRPVKPQQFPNSNRYTLTDPGSGSAPAPGPRQGSPSAPGRGQSPSSRPVAGSLPDPASTGTGTGTSTPPRKTMTGPTTFAEMGIQGAKAEEKECVIM